MSQVEVRERIADGAIAPTRPPVLRELFAGNDAVSAMQRRSAAAVKEAALFHAAIGLDHGYSLTVNGPFQPHIIRFENPPLEDGDVTIAVDLSGLSNGTEIATFAGDNPNIEAVRDPDTGLYRPRRGTAPPQFPERTAYMEIGVVARTRNRRFPEGTVVALNQGRVTSLVADPDTIATPDKPNGLILPLPADLDPLLGTEAAHTGPIAYMPLAGADLEEWGRNYFVDYRGDRKIGASTDGKHVLVVGGGLIGFRTALLAQDAGAEVMVADANEHQLALPRALGMKTVHVDSSDSNQLAEEVKTRWRTHKLGGAQVVIETTGRIEGIVAATKAAEPDAPVLLVSMPTKAPDRVLRELGELLRQEGHHNGPTWKVTQIGRKPRGLTQRMLAEQYLTVLHDEKNRDAVLASKSHLFPASSYPDVLDFLRLRSRRPNLTDKQFLELSDVTSAVDTYAFQPGADFTQGTFYFDRALIPQLERAAA